MSVTDVCNTALESLLVLAYIYTYTHTRLCSHVLQTVEEKKMSLLRFFISGSSFALLWELSGKYFQAHNDIVDVLKIQMLDKNVLGR